MKKSKKSKKIKRLSKSEVSSLTEFETLPESVVGALNGNCILLDAFENALDDFTYAEAVDFKTFRTFLNRKEYKKALGIVLVDQLYELLISYDLRKKDFKSLAYYVRDYILENCEHKKLI